jgi:hypothetical protein
MLYESENTLFNQPMINVFLLDFIFPFWYWLISFIIPNQVGSIATTLLINYNHIFISEWFWPNSLFIIRILYSFRELNFELGLFQVWYLFFKIISEKKWFEPPNHYHFISFGFNALTLLLTIHNGISTFLSVHGFKAQMFFILMNRNIIFIIFVFNLFK